MQAKGRHERSAQLRALSQKHRKEWSSGGQQGAQPAKGVLGQPQAQHKLSPCGLQFATAGPQGQETSWDLRHAGSITWQRNSCRAEAALA